MRRKPVYLLGLDCGTQSATAAVFTLDGRVVGHGNTKHPIDTSRAGWAEQDPATWWRSSQAAIRRALAGLDSRRIGAVGIAFQRETFTILDGRGRFLRPAILWLDGRAAREARKLGNPPSGARIHRLTGKPLDATGALPRLLWLKRNEPGVMRRAAHWHDVGAELGLKFTGRRATCVSGADTCGLVGLRTRDWLDPLIRKAGMRREQFPDLVEPGAVIGPLGAMAAAATGLPAGLPVVAAGGDGQVFAAGQAPGPFSLSLSLGTSVILGMVSPRPAISPLFRTLLIRPGGYLLECVLQSGTHLTRWFRENMSGDPSLDEAYWEKAVADIPPGSEGLVTIPHWWGARFPEFRPGARGVVSGWGNHHTRAHLYRSLLEGIAFELNRALMEYTRLFPAVRGRAIRIGGGGARGLVFRRILADVLDRPLVIPDHPHDVAAGAAVMAGSGAGILPSRSFSRSGRERRKRVIRPAKRTTNTYRRIFEKSYLPLANRLP